MRIERNLWLVQKCSVWIQSLEVSDLFCQRYINRGVFVRLWHGHFSCCFSSQVCWRRVSLVDMNWKGAVVLFSSWPHHSLSLFPAICRSFAIDLLSVLNESICFTSSHLGVNEGENTIRRTEKKNKPGPVPRMGFVGFLLEEVFLLTLGARSVPSWTFEEGMLSFQLLEVGLYWRSNLDHGRRLMTG